MVNYDKIQRKLRRSVIFPCCGFKCQSVSSEELTFFSSSKTQDSLVSSVQSIASASSRGRTDAWTPFTEIRECGGRRRVDVLGMVRLLLPSIRQRLGFVSRYFLAHNLRSGSTSKAICSRPICGLLNRYKHLPFARPMCSY